MDLHDITPPPLMLFNTGKRCNATLSFLAGTRGLRLNAPMQGTAILVLLGFTALGAYSVGRQSAPVGSLTAASVSAPSPATAKPVAYTSPAAPVLISAPPPNSSNTANPPARASLPDKPASAGPDSKPSGTETKRKVEGALTAAAIARSSWRPAVPNITREGGLAPAQTTLCGVVEPAAGGAPIHDRAVRRRFAIRAT